jgi:O-antigen/teichoic acid export membrane protein
LAQLDIKERTVKGFVGLGTAKILAQTFAWTLSIAIARLLDPADYGLMALGMFFVNFFSFISEFGLGSALIQRKDLEDRDIHTSFWVMLAANVGIFLVVMLMSHLIADFYETPKLALVIQVLGLHFIISSVRTVPLCLLTRELQFERCARAELYGSLVSSAAMLWLAFHQFGVWCLVLGSVIDNIVTSVFMLRYYPWAPRPVFEYGRVKGMLRYGSSVNGAKILTYLSSNADNLIVGKALGGHALGLYNMAFVIGTMPTRNVAPIIFRIWFPVLARLQDDRERSRQYLLTFSRYIALCAAPAMLGMMLVADDFVSVVLGQKWESMVMPLRLLCSVGILKALAVTLTPVLTARERTRSLLAYCALEGVVLSAAFYIGSQFGISGVAAGWLCLYPVLFGYLLSQVLDELRIPLRAYLSNLKFVAFATTAMTITIFVVRGVVAQGGAVRLVTACVAGAVVYGAAALLLDRTLLKRIRRAASLANPWVASSAEGQVADTARNAEI